MDIQTVIVSTILGIGTSSITAYITTRLRMKEERKKWDREITLKYAEATHPDAADTLARQFAVGYLIVQQPTGERGRIFVPKGSRITIGRSLSRCQVVLDDPMVSSVTAMIESDGASVFVVDLCATNGTFLNGVRLASGSRSKLKSGDLIRVGDSELVFQGMERGD